MTIKNGLLGESLSIKPLEKEIFLFDTIVASTTYIDNIVDIAERLDLDDILTFSRKSENSCDEKAIRIETDYGEHIGYVPIKDNVVFNRLMNSGNVLIARISSKEIKNDWVKIDIKVFLKDLI